jgi:hypothetical protein
MSVATSSLRRIHLRGLFPNLSGIDDEFEWVRILVLLHQLVGKIRFMIGHRSGIIRTNHLIELLGDSGGRWKLHSHSKATRRILSGL